MAATLSEQVYHFVRALAKHLLYDEREANLVVLKQSDGLSSFRQLGTLHNVCSPLMLKEGVEHRLLQISDAMDHALRFIKY